MIEHSYEKIVYDRSTGMLKVHGIVAIIFGIIGTLTSVLLMLLITITTYADSEYDAHNSPLGLYIIAGLIFVFWALPHIFLVTSGSYLIRQPVPKLARILVIINLVIGVFYNFIILIFAIVNLTQITDYERSYHIYKR